MYGLSLSLSPFTFAKECNVMYPIEFRFRKLEIGFFQSLMCPLHPKACNVYDMIPIYSIGLLLYIFQINGYELL